MDDYHNTRDFPALNGTSRLSVHLRFGTVSIRDLVRLALDHNQTYLNELIWREFYMMILWHFPSVVDKAFKPKYDRIEWLNSEKHFEAWCAGQTGYPIVDAGMRELSASGFMHNRVRMITASFLTKHLLIDWRWGEAWFAKKLLDYELSSNNGGWQWAAGSGCDAAPYFRVFNPYLQSQKFDPDQAYIKKWVPEYQDMNYPPPIVDHKFARKRALTAYKKAIG
jgi:deoxyribodipyrimidine photo-lyase